MKWTLGKILTPVAALSESYCHVGRWTYDGPRALCDVGLGSPLPGRWSAEVDTEEAVRRLRAAPLVCPRCPAMLAEWRDPVTRLGEVSDDSGCRTSGRGC